MHPFLLVFLGGGLGAVLRHGAGVIAVRALGTQFPYGTLAVNVVGALVMGAAVAWFGARGELSSPLRLFLTTGLLGGFTTFSAFSLETVLLYERGLAGLALLYVLASVVVCVGALVAGMALVKALPA